MKGKAEQPPTPAFPCALCWRGPAAVRPHLIALTRLLVQAESPSSCKMHHDACLALAAARAAGWPRQLHRPPPEQASAMYSRSGFVVRITLCGRKTHPAPWPFEHRLAARHAQDHALSTEPRPALGSRHARHESRRGHGLYRHRATHSSSPAPTRNRAPAHDRRGNRHAGITPHHGVDR